MLEVLKQAAWDGCGATREPANRLGMGLSAAKSRIQCGRDQLKTMLLDCCHFDFDRRGKVIECELRSKDSSQECG